ncbi:MAG TPA: DUF523 domain-containing protein [Aquihabitans sp.]|jgi:uncharacterized protein YbbK (DUF523 family)|nr:DUF523 domain-containing protein [Aquihabitans sp.]
MADGTARQPPDRGPSLLVSACLVGVECNHRGAASARPAVAALADRFDLLPVCPEVEGGLPVPRDAAERTPGGRVVTVAGEDVTQAYRRGAEVAVTLARAQGVAGAVLKARSPSCGCHQVYDGTFTRTLVDGEGLTAAALRAAGYDVVSEEDVAAGRLPGRLGDRSNPTDRPGIDR